MWDLLRVSGDPFSRDHFQPGHFTASAFVLSPDERHILLIEHAKLGLWLQPGGHIDPEDVDVFLAAGREVAEETGVADPIVLGGFPALLDVDIHTIPANPKKGEPAHEHFDVRVLFRAPDLAFSAGSDALAAKWVALDRVESIDTDESVMRAVRKLRGREGS